MSSLSTAGDVHALWLATLQRLMGRVSHDVKDSLNGVSVNLEVIRSRTAGAAAPRGGAIAPFAEAAGQQLERLTSLLEAMLAVGRTERDPVDVRMTLHRVAVLSGASSSSADALVEVADDDESPATTGLAGDVVRLALAASLLDLVTGSGGGVRATTVRCTLHVEPAEVVVTIGATGRRAAMPPDVADALRAAGVRWSGGAQETGDLSLVFPRA